MSRSRQESLDHLAMAWGDRASWAVRAWPTFQDLWRAQSTNIYDGACALGPVAAGQNYKAPMMESLFNAIINSTPPKFPKS